MRIALVVPGFSQGPEDWAIPSLQSLAAVLAKEHEVHVYSLRYPKAGRYSFSGITHWATGGGTTSGLASFPIWWHTYKRLLEHHRNKPFDVIHAYWADEPGFVAALAARRAGIPSLVSLAGGELVYFRDIDYGTQGSIFRRWIIWMALRSATLTTAGSTYQHELALQKGFPPEKLLTIPLGVDTSIFRPAELPDWHRPTIVQAAALTPVKNQRGLLAVLRKVREAEPTIRLLLAGSGPLESKLLRISQEYKLEESIDWQGKVDHGMMPQVYHGGHVYVQTSRHESQGMSVLEAMACGVPVLGTAVGILPEVACQPPSSDPSILAEQVLEVLNHRRSYETFRQEAIDSVNRSFSLTVCTAKLIRTYQSLLKGQ